MDWTLRKTTSSSWDIPEFEQENSLGGEQIKVDFSVDLKLGHVVNAGDSKSRDNLAAPGVPKKALMPPVGPSKRARAVDGGVNVAYCVVDGCNADLSGCREYHRRHKVCEMHSKAPEVTIGGLKQRFCQQCSRFHSLEEFDEGKRSCRKRLEGHNRRRRKSQPDPFSRSSTFLSDYHGTRLFPFSSAESYPATAFSRPIWAGNVKTEQDSPLYNRHLHGPVHSQYLGPSSSSYREGKPSSFVHGSTLVLSNQASSEASCGQQFYSSPETSGRGRELLSPGLSTQSLNSNCALSLLSSPPIRSPEIIPSHMAPPNSIPTPHPFGLSLQSNSLQSINLVLGPNSDEGMFDVGHGSSSNNEETSQTLPFCWE